MRVLVAAPAGIGHVHPLLPLSLALRDRGHDVLFAVAAEHQPAIEGVGIRSVAAGMSQPERLARANELAGVEVRDLPPRAHGDVGFPFGFGAAAMPAMLDELRPIAAAHRPEVIVHDVGELASPLLAAELGITHLAHSFGTTPLPSRLEKAGELTAHLWEQAGLTQPPFAGVFADVYVDIRPDGLDGHPPAGTHVVRERPASLDALGGGVPEALAEPSDRPLVYATLGTNFAAVQVLRMLAEAVADLPVRAVLTVGPRGAPDALGTVPPNVHVERYVPQGQLLPLCDLVASHAGSGTFLGALAHGLPQLCLPQGADQFLNADAGHAAGAAIVLEPADASTQAIRSAVEHLLASPSYRASAGRIADEIAAMPTADEVAAGIEELVHS
ncbi:MAG TPA: nucleotide disphospho-sugar-binding domain-containing protein [Mycobacteriales bacterium]|nr:nucleotide disphospho-sugar-binding domain-containing protein [Mycobacteriales bacterium]